MKLQDLTLGVGWSLFWMTSQPGAGLRGELLGFKCLVTSVWQGSAVSFTQKDTLTQPSVANTRDTCRIKIS